MVGFLFLVCLVLFTCLGLGQPFCSFLLCTPYPPNLPVSRLICSFFLVFCQGQCVFRLEGVAQHSLSLGPAMKIPLRNSLELSWTALHHFSEGLGSLLQYLIMLPKSLRYHIMPPNELSIKGFLHLLIISFLFLSFPGMSAASQSPPWAICVPDETWCSLKCPCLPRQVMQLSGILSRDVPRAQLLTRSAGIVPVLKEQVITHKQELF